MKKLFFPFVVLFLSVLFRNVFAGDSSAIASFNTDTVQCGSGSANDTEQIIVHNNGSTLLHVTNISIDNSLFTVVTQPFTIRPGDSAAITFVLEEPSLLDITAHLLIASNDYGHPVDSISVIDLADLISVKETPLHMFQLSSYPNPATTMSNVYFNLPSPSLVTLQIFNSFGTCVKTILNNILESGTITVPVTFDFPPGMYFYKFSSGNKTTVNKFIVLH